MRLYHSTSKVLLTMFFLVIGTPAVAQNEIGKVEDVKSSAWVERDGNEVKIAKTDAIRLGDTVFVKNRPKPNKVKLKFEMSAGDEHGSIELMRGGKVRFFGETGSEVKCEYLNDGHLIVGKPCEPIVKDGRLEVTHTIYELDIQPRSTRLFVYEGSVSVYSTDTSFPDPRVVHAGEWVRFSEGKEIPKPKRFTLAIGPGSGSTECIYSDCKLVNSVLIPSRPVVTPEALIPPPPNPPGRR